MRHQKKRSTNGIQPSLKAHKPSNNKPAPFIPDYKKLPTPVPNSKLKKSQTVTNLNQFYQPSNPTSLQKELKDKTVKFIEELEHKSLPLQDIEFLDSLNTYLNKILEPDFFNNFSAEDTEKFSSTMIRVLNEVIEELTDTSKIELITTYQKYLSEIFKEKIEKETPQFSG